MGLNVVEENDSNRVSPIQRLKESRKPKRKKFVGSKVIKAGMGDRLKSWRKAAKLNLTQLAKKLGLGITTLSEIESNKSLPSADTLARLHKKTNLNILWLMFQEENMLQDDKKEKVVKAVEPVKPKKVIKKTIFNMTIAELNRR